MELTLWMRVGIFIAILVIAYFIMRYFEIDPIMGFWESISGMEWNLKALILTILFSSLMLAFIWKSPMWITPEVCRFTKVTCPPMKILISILLPIIGYPLAANALNK